MTLSPRPGFPGMLDSLVQMIELQSPSMRCSILLLASDGKTLRHGAGPSLPEHYNAAIDGLEIGPGVGSCGTAAFSREMVIVDDIATHEYWAPFRDLALPCGLRACWSTPILGSDDACLGTFAMYYTEPRKPEPSDIKLIRTAATLAAALVERERLLASSEADRSALTEANDQLEEQAVELEFANQHLQDSAAELEMQAEAIESARAEAEKANLAKSEFLATMSHELRTPLNAVGGYADLLLAGIRGVLTPAQRSDVERIKRSGDHLLGLINDILNFAKLEAGKIDFHIAELPVAPVLLSLEEIVRPQVDTKPLAYAHRLGEGEIAVRADSEKMRQVLLNLVTNAVKFTDPGGRIDVECDADDEWVHIHVRDTGRGIPDEHLGRIFDPFVQIDRDRTPRSQQGVGLGLSISRDLAAAMGGSLKARSKEGVGSTFTLTLPRAGKQAPPPS